MSINFKETNSNKDFTEETDGCVSKKKNKQSTE